ncbi:MAG: AhpC/TSA family protein [Bacteroidales bacterium]|nr:AhpC/TSA family protein [Bacteroidales bacterium]
MKKLLPLSLVVLALMCGCSKGVKYKISGRVPAGLDVKTMYLVDPSIETPIDSVEVKSDSTFVFSGTVTEPMIAIVAGKEDPRLQWLLIVEKGKIELNDKDGSVSGGELNDAIASFSKTLSELQMSAPETFEEESMKVVEEYVGNHSNDLAGVRILYSALVTGLIDEDTYLRLYGTCGEVVQKHEQIALTKQMIEARDASNVGNKFIEVNGTIDGKEAHLSDYVGKGSWVLVDFWASWCRPCREEMPFLKQALEKYSGQGLQLISIAVNDDAEKALNTAKELEMTWPVMTDTKETDIVSWGFASIPQVFLLDPDGTIVLKEMRGEELIKAIGDKLAGK